MMAKRSTKKKTPQEKDAQEKSAINQEWIEKIETEGGPTAAFFAEQLMNQAEIHQSYVGELHSHTLALLEAVMGIHGPILEENKSASHRA